MAFSHALVRQQVARIVAHAAGDEILLSFEGQRRIPALFARDRQAGTQAMSTGKGNVLCILTIARTALLATAKLPREGTHFSDEATGKHYRIAEVRTVPHAPVFTFACITPA